MYGSNNMKKSVVFDGQFDPKLSGQFELESGGQFTLELGGQFDRFFHYLSKVIK
jgi:hypothetical protein